MVIRRPNKSWFAGSDAARRGALMTDLLVAIAIFTLAVLPVGFAFVQEERLLRAEYAHAVAMEIVDGEMEVLVAGEWRAFKEGTQPYPVRAESATNLPPGQFQLTIEGKQLRLEWSPRDRGHGGKVVREATFK